MGLSRQEYWSGCPCRISQPKDQTQISHIAGGFFTIWATREAPRKCALRANKKNLETSLEEACTFRRRPDIRCLCCFPLPCSFFPPLLVEVTDSSWAISYPKGWCCERAALNMPASLDNSTVAKGLEKVSFSLQSQRKAMSKNVQTAPVALISYASKILLKILQARLQQYVNCELPDVQAGFRKGRGTRDQIANIHWIIGKAREFQKNIYFCFIDYTKDFDCVAHSKLWKILQEMVTLDHLTCFL